ncbi:hypothetical protein P0D68_03180 [Paraburkholderia sp. RL17-380-BIE-A]|uniref:hypothetical protein n=1 Tax=Paraburkholderia sp. RL17-380-BIE-A TaxID=3031630 RepID=UPI0038BA1412
MQRIDAQYDLPQFVASSLVRKIAANKFRLPATDRSKFQNLPDEVIVRIEKIVRDAYIEAGEDVGGNALREHLWQQSLDARHAMIANGELISEDDFRQRLGVTPRRLSKLLTDGSVFKMAVDDLEYYPAVLADPALDRDRLQAICRIIVPAPSGSRLDFLVSSRGSMGGRSPIQMLTDDIDFNALQRVAAVWTAEWSRTVVKMYEGKHEVVPDGVQPLYTAAAEIDPRKPLWDRVSEALYAHGYEWPLGPYPTVRKFTLFVERHTAGQSTLTPEACVQIVVDGEYVRSRVVAAPGTVLHPETVLRDKHESFVEIAKRIITHLCKRI